MIALLVMATAFTFTPLFRPTTLQPFFFVLTLALVLLFSAIDVILGVSPLQGCTPPEGEDAPSSAQECDALCESGLTVEQTDAGRAIWFTSQYDFFVVLILFIVPLDAPLAISIAFLFAALNEVLLQQTFSYRLVGSYTMHSVFFIILSTVTVIQNRAMRSSFLTNMRLAAELDRRIENLHSAKERMEWERDMDAKYRARAANLRDVAEASKSSEDARSDRTPKNAFRPCVPTESDGGSMLQSTLGSLPNEWPRSRQDEPYSGRPACYPVADLPVAARGRGTSTLPRFACGQPGVSAQGAVPTIASEPSVISATATRPRPATPSPSDDV